MILLSVIIVKPVIAQTDSTKVEKVRKNAVFIRICTIAFLGISNSLVLYSLFYERIIIAKNIFKFTTSIGFSVSKS